MYGCCNCGADIKLDDESLIVCPDCGGFCCTEDCFHDHECDEEGDL